MLNDIPEPEASLRDTRSESLACLLEAQELSELTDDVGLKQRILASLVNLTGRLNTSVHPAGTDALVSRMNALLVQTGRVPDTSCAICLDAFTGDAQPGSGAERDAAGAGGRPSASSADSSVHVLHCGHHSHLGCLRTWWCTGANPRRGNQDCPLCRK